jgi:hypothetical protein
MILSLKGITQIQKGNWILGGRANYYQNSNKLVDTVQITDYNIYKGSNFSAYLNAGYFFTDNLAVGLFIGGSSGSSINEFSYANGSYGTQKYHGESKSTGYSTGAFMRLYDLNKESKLRVFVQLDGFYDREERTDKSRQDQNNSFYEKEVHSKNDRYGIGIAPGIVYLITKKIGLETTFGSVSYYHSINTQSSLGTKTGTTIGDGFSAGFSLSTLYVGVQFYLGK